MYYEILDENCFESFDFEGPLQSDDIATSTNVLAGSEQVSGSTDTVHGDVTILGILQATVALWPDVKVNWTISDIRRISTIVPKKDKVHEEFHILLDTDSWSQLIWRYIVTDVFYAAEFKIEFRDEPNNYPLDIKSLENDGKVRRADAASATGATFSYDDESVELTVSHNLGLPFAVGGYYLSSDF